MSALHFERREDALAQLVALWGGVITGSTLQSAEPSARTFITEHRCTVVIAGEESVRTIYLDDSDRFAGHEGVTRVRTSMGSVVTAWEYPNDPALPLLPSAVYPASAGVVLSRVGINASMLRLEVVAYRPGSRAVVRADSDAGTVYLKIVKPGQAEHIAGLHASWGERGIPVPRVLASSSDGLLVMTKLAGTPAVQLLADDPSELVASVSAVMDTIAAVPSVGAARESLVDRLDWYAAKVTTLAPSKQAEVAELTARIQRLRQNDPPRLTATVHGDLHLAQLLVDPRMPGQITGVLDIDTAGRGDPADDHAALWAHLVATSAGYERAGSAQRASASKRTAKAFCALWRTKGIHKRTAAIAATHVLGHAITGSLSVEYALENARQVLDYAESVG